MAFLFPGQGTQRVGMGQGLYRRHAVVRAVFDEASDLTGRDMAAACFRSTPDELRRTVLAQPALYTLGAASTALLRSWGIEPVAVAGHSVGELAALHAAGALDFAGGLDLVNRRASLMAAATSEGAMVAVTGLSLDAVSDVCELASRPAAPVVIGLHNARGRVVVSGAEASVAVVAERSRALGATRVTRLETEHAYHSPLMEPVVPDWRQAVAAADLAPPTVPVATNATGALVSDPEELRHALVAHLTSPVDWVGCMRALSGLGVGCYVETADTKVLSALVRANNPGAKAITLADPRAPHRLAEAHAMEDSHAVP